jgi:hypothetical protein
MLAKLRCSCHLPGGPRSIREGKRVEPGTIGTKIALLLAPTDTGKDVQHAMGRADGLWYLYTRDSGAEVGRKRRDRF